MMSSDDQATTEDRCSELSTPVSIPSVSEARRKLSALASGNSREGRGLRWRLKQANKTMGKQGQTIANLRGELARIREEHSKIERGELRRLQRYEETAKEVIRQQGEEIARLRVKLDWQPPGNLPPRTKDSQPNPDYIAAVEAQKEAHT